ncbi:hypothetical protein BASA84_001319 [Batrachochytrium salamandrivorans]|nr:hypothetical protein BASA62_004143 [Batrachochytrium salamandrivorans]KAH9266051.1 hypothetical protein BASA84_001319 [Batrachochytrium salamandrivorans]
MYFHLRILNQKKRPKGSLWRKLLSKPPPQQQSPSGSQPSTSYASPKSDKMPFPVRVRKLELKSYGENCDAEQYNAFIKEETKYFEPKYSSGEILAKDDFGTPFVATRKSDGMKVAYKSIPKSEVYEYALESSPYPICHLRNHLVCSKKQSVEQCISSRQLNLFLPYELMFQTYLSRPGYDNPYVPMTLDYIVLEDECILVMEHFGEKSVTLSSYVKEKGRLDVGEARSIIKEVVDAVRSLKRHGILHKDLRCMYQ